ncbi:hypothetical protein C8R44DRAFT_857534 [Mycena epipterygia]|nr:hypothetical protein C8R44DRAFT_857534 [Mycena epipterygia]
MLTDKNGWRWRVPAITRSQTRRECTPEPDSLSLEQSANSGFYATTSVQEELPTSRNWRDRIDPVRSGRFDSREFNLNLVLNHHPQRQPPFHFGLTALMTKYEGYWFLERCYLRKYTSLNQHPQRHRHPRPLAPDSGIIWLSFWLDGTDSGVRVRLVPGYKSARTDAWKLMNEAIPGAHLSVLRHPPTRKDMRMAVPSSYGSAGACGFPVFLLVRGIALDPRFLS